MHAVEIKRETRRLLERVVGDVALHARWLNTLSYLENAGAKKIARYEHPTRVKEETLKHAAEEFRHAHHLKRQIRRLTEQVPEDYSVTSIFGHFKTWRYLDSLEVFVSRCVRERCNSLDEMHEAAYILVTYAIELRASELYPEYDEVLHTARSKVSVRSILLEEEEHLEEMRHALEKMSGGEELLERACRRESELFGAWVVQVGREILGGNSSVVRAADS